MMNATLTRDRLARVMAPVLYRIRVKKLSGFGCDVGDGIGVHQTTLRGGGRKLAAQTDKATAVTPRPCPTSC
jgi:hypothetical protein